MIKYLVIPLVAVVTGCSVLGDAPLALFSEVVEKGMNVEDKTFDAAAKAIDKYCETAPEDARLYLRDGVNSRTERGDIVVSCD